MARRPLLVGLLGLALALVASPCAAQTEFERRWTERVRSFEAENARLDPHERTVVLLGSSTMEGWGQGVLRVSRFLPGGRHYLNRGISGDGIGESSRTGILHRLESSALRCRPSHVFLLNGRNSIGRDGAQVERTARLFREVVQRLRRGLPDTVVVVITDVPVNLTYAPMAPGIVRYNALLAQIARDEGCPLIDLHARLVGPDGLLPRSMTRDGLHFGDEGYRILGEEIARVLAGSTPPAADGLPGAPPTRTTPAATPAPVTTAVVAPPPAAAPAGFARVVASVRSWFADLGRALGLVPVAPRATAATAGAAGVLEAVGR